MQEAIRQAQLGMTNGDYGIGAVVVKDNKIVAAEHSKSKIDENPLGHAETLVIYEASKILKSRHIVDCVLYTTAEPCPMCAGAAIWAKMKGIVYGTNIADMEKFRKGHANEKYLWRTIDIPCKEVVSRSTEKIDVVENFMREECLKLFHN